MKFFKTAKVDFKEHQKLLQEKLQNQRGALLYWGLGSGKTLGAIGAAEASPQKNIDVVVPASLVPNFKKELEKIKSKKKYNIRSYEKFIKSPNHSNQFFIIDEAHRLKDETSKRAKEILKQTQSAEKVLLLTGTPIPNKPKDISVLVNTITGKRTLPTGSDFDKHFLYKKYTSPGFFKSLLGEPDKVSLETKNMDKFKKAVHNLTSYYQPPSNIEDFPNVNNFDILVDMTPDQIKVYQALYSNLSPDVKYKIMNNISPNEKDISKINVFLNAARQINNTAGYAIKEVDSLNYPKFKKIMDYIKNNEGPHLIYSNYLDSGVKPMSSLLEQESIPHALFTGDQNIKEKDQIVKDYNSGKLKALLVSSAGGEGLDLKNTRSIHIMEPHWNKSKINQVVGRGIRFQSHSSLPEDKRNVNVYQYFSTLPLKQPGFFGKLFGSNPARDTSADQYLLNMSKEKEILNKKFLDALVQTSMENQK